ncbi:PstS family phosphate ABC transporter substrate-binding protein [Tenggerimyces flavus]|uniref:PstS family phosphate ABC transporter substrate-binding protein n=1 Tax=Tenggerimyces flavus TaxID=1708749 RepID=A0ABV7YS19_9ACTN|nr:substrate-binding domain-containing protein [Tenggerimyces flavus]MBM7786455.1 ABC-type phosphate transport system substrate-binding protein [Tenggerimyces flavus]
MRKIIKRGLAVTAAAVLSVGLAASTALGDPGNYHPAFATDTSDVVGVGSDTSELVLNALADGLAPNFTDGFNELGRNGVVGGGDDNPADRLASFDATGSANITIRPGLSIPRPNGSSQGIAALQARPQIDFARSSRALTAAEVSAGLRMVPFARDTLVLVTNSGRTAPATLTNAQLLGIYECTITNWSQVSGTPAGVIKPLIPQTGSGSRQFFIDQLTAIKGSPYNPNQPCLTVTQEHDPAPVIANSPNAIGPFSLGRFNQLPAATKSQLRTFTNPRWTRVLYNILRATQVTTAKNAAVFSSTGFICSTKGKAIVTANGFQTLASGCGIPRTTPLP